MSKAWTTALGALLLAGCAGPEAPRWSGYLNRKAMKVAVMKPIDSGAIVMDDELDATYARVVEELEHRGFQVLPKAELEAVYQKKGVGIRAEMFSRFKGKNDELAKEAGVDAVLWTNVTNWDKEISGVKNQIRVKIEFFLMDEAGDKAAWSNHAERTVTRGAKVPLNPTQPRKPTAGDLKGIGQGMLLSTLETIIDSPLDLMPPIVREAFASLGHAGYGN